MCRFNACVTGYHACIERQKSASASLQNPSTEVEDCEPFLAIQKFSRDLDQACHMTTVTAWQGMSVWRWLLFFGLFWPLQLVAYFIARMFTSLVQFNLFGGHVRSSTTAPYKQHLNEAYASPKFRVTILQSLPALVIVAGCSLSASSANS
jgi:hypothetical protein